MGMATEEGGRLGRAWRTLLLLAITAVFVFPVYWTLSLSVKPKTLMFNLPPRWAFTPTWANFAEVLTDHDFIRNILNSLILSVTSTLLVVIIGTPAAYSLARLRPRGRDDLMLFVLGSRMAPPIALVIPFFLIYRTLGLLETHLGLIIAYMTFNLSFYVWLLAVFSRDLPADLEGAGFADGYGPTYVFFRVMLPLMRPIIIASAVLVFIFAWNEFLFALILGGQSAETLPVAISRFITPSGVQFGPLAALGTVAVLPVAIVVFVLHKHIVRGLSMGAVKG
jgi:multiple sugar transport system permease protein